MRQYALGSNEVHYNFCTNVQYTPHLIACIQIYACQLPRVHQSWLISAREFEATNIIDEEEMQPILLLSQRIQRHNRYHRQRVEDPERPIYICKVVYHLPNVPS